ncbi:hypothetical protein HPE56_08255 [Maribacter sp. ANRC-HE7]|uniref:Mannosylglycerate hydrolase MGH1-like glycoside hydrolase domain-containing protein n=1 Tax=Maribacter aquimaris TaxID=2737171 RepID=A0ABR7V3N0_9FLAO|nr:hypothetical protein [Maribacter aquimaris]MBD0777782.1 hypothetical protein [Maribacter aquimaris]
MKIIFVYFLLVANGLLAQEISCDNQSIVEAYKLAISTVDINTRSGILAAGGGYGGEWTRDIAINSWNGVSLLRPEVAEKSLWSVTLKDKTIGHQYWDKMLWSIAVLNHYKVTGDLEFLRKAYKYSANTMNQLEDIAFDSDYGLFTGPSVFNDGIAGYPEPIFEPSNKASNILKFKNSSKIKCLSTNSVYYGSYQSLIEMGQILNVNSSVIKDYSEKSKKLKTNILKYFYSEKEHALYYLIDQLGKVHKYQEGLGISFATIFGILNKSQASDVIRNAHVSKYGITSIYPDFPRYSAEKPGRHNNIIWPMVNGFFAKASIIAGSNTNFDFELNALTHLVLDEDKGNYNFREIFNPYTGAPDGGWQCDHQWDSVSIQSWSATAYIDMIYFGLAGIRLENNGIVFAPYLPENIHYLQLNDVVYRNSTLNITLLGNGNKIKSFMLNGRQIDDYKIDSNIKGENTLIIELE